MVKFNKEEVQILIKIIYKHFNQKIIVRDLELLDSAIESVFQTFDNNELYPSIEEKGARICFNIINNHPFVDGNKRVGILTMLTFLEVNNVNLKYTNEEIINIGLALASGKMNYEVLVNWVVEHNCLNKEQSNIER